MKKLFEFEKYVKDQNFEKFFKMNPLLEDFLWKIKNFFDDILIDGHNVIITDHSHKNDNVYLEISKSTDKDDYVICVNFVSHDDYVQIFLKKKEYTKIYNLLLEYIHYEISNVFPKVNNVVNKPEEETFSFYYKKLSKGEIDKINFSKEEYEIFKDTERFGL